MKYHCLPTILCATFLGFLVFVEAQSSEEEDPRFSRQSDFEFSGVPRRQQQHDFGPPEGGLRHSRPRPFRPPFLDSAEGGGGGGGGDSLGDVDGGGGGGGGDRGRFQEPHLLPPQRTFRPTISTSGSGGSGGGISRFQSRPQFSAQDFENEADTGGKIKASQTTGGLDDPLEGGVASDKEKPEPDRLALLLQESKFSCTEKKPGYYADDGLSCEVFHYCNEGVRHSWMCPAGTSFHQIHLICMQEGGDNICKQSTKYHFVNDYLYKPLEQSTRESNGTIRYADRYFPDEGGPAVSSDGGQSIRGGGGSSQFQDGGIQDGGDSFRPIGRPQHHSSEGGAGGNDFFSLPPPPPPRHHSSSSSGSRFRPAFEDDGSSAADDQFASGPPPQFSRPSSSSPSQRHQAPHPSSLEDLGAFGSEEDTGSQFQAPPPPPPPPHRVRGRHGNGRGQRFPTFGRS